MTGEARKERAAIVVHLEAMVRIHMRAARSAREGDDDAGAIMHRQRAAAFRTAARVITAGEHVEQANRTRPPVPADIAR